jgi:hypothetical protein
LLYGKKLFLTFGLLALVFPVLLAQIAIVTKAGVTLANLYTTSTRQELQTITGWMAGVGVNVPISKVWSLQPELLYLQKGFRMGHDQRCRLDYLELPFLLKVNFENQGFIPYLVGGPSASLLLEGIYRDASGTLLKLNRQKVAIGMRETLTTGTEQNSIFHKAELGFQLGAGASLPLPKGRALVKLRYGQSLTDFFRMTSISGNSKYTNRVVQLTLGYALSVGKQ